MKWINSYISKTGHPLIVNLEEQLSDGLTLIKLLEALGKLVEYSYVEIEHNHTNFYQPTLI